MKKILLILPKDSEERLVAESFTIGFQSRDARVLAKELHDLSEDDFRFFKPDIVFGINYSFLNNMEFRDYIINSGKKLVFYFMKEPQSSELLSFDKRLFELLNELDSYVFVWDKDLKKEFKNAVYLPLAASRVKYAIDFSGYDYDISYVGCPKTDYGLKILSDLFKIYKNKLNIFASQENFKKCLDKIKKAQILDAAQLKGFAKLCKPEVIDEQGLAKIYNSSKININLSEDGKNSINYRVFEVLASGGFLITNERDDLKLHFQISRHLETYKDMNDLTDKIDFYLNNLNIAQKVAQLGRFQCFDAHNFSARARQILKKTAL